MKTIKFFAIIIAITFIFTACEVTDSGHRVAIYNKTDYDVKVSYIDENDTEQEVILAPHKSGPAENPSKGGVAFIYSKMYAEPDIPPFTEETFRLHIKKIKLEPLNSDFILDPALDLRDIKHWRYHKSPDDFMITHDYTLEIKDEMSVTRDR